MQIGLNNIKTTVNKNVQHIDHHISEYTKIISELKNEISELKSKIAHSGSGGNLKMIMSEDDTLKFKEVQENSGKIEEYLETLSAQFLEETKLIKRVDELTIKYSMNRHSTINANTLLEELKEKVGNREELVSQVERELKILDKNDVDFKEKLDK